MKKFYTLLTFVLLSFISFAQSLVMINTKEIKETKLLFNDENLKIHYYNDNFVLATTIDNNMVTMEYTLLDEVAFSNNDAYYIINCNNESQMEYVKGFEENVLYRGKDIIVTNKSVQPFKNDGMIAVFNKEAKMPVVKRDFPTVTDENPLIREMMNQVSMDSLQAYVQHMQDYGERIFNGTTILQCTEWLKSKFEALGLETELQDFHVSSWLGEANCKNVIAIQRGTLYPDTYVVCGSHYDSFAWYGDAPGADDNATGSASVLESARILSQYDFEYSIVYCIFSAEECGLYGSEAYASRCRQQNMDIIGYFNNDMNGYLAGDEIHIDCIYPNSVAPIGDYYINIGQVYFPEMQVRHVNFNEGDSDHTSFNNNGYMGIYPFEDYQDYSPYIHSGNDIIGLSVNSFEMSQRYCQMNIGCLTEIANPTGSLPQVECNPVTNFAVEAAAGDELCNVMISWDSPQEGSTGDVTKYVIYRDDAVLTELNNDIFDYQDTISVGITAEYYINTVFSDGCEAASEKLSAEGVFDAMDEVLSNSFSIYPNPASEMLTIVNNSDKVLVVKIINSIGQTIKNITLVDIENVNISEMESGVYFVISDNIRHKLVIK